MRGRYSKQGVDMIKRSLAVTLGLLFLAGSSLVWADTTSPAKVSHPKHHKKGHKPKSELNPQPLPPRKAPGTNGPAGSGPGIKSGVQ